MNAIRKPPRRRRNDHHTPLTDKQREVFDFLVSHAVEHLYQPSAGDAADHFGWKSRMAYFHCLGRLHDKGWVGEPTAEGRAVRIIRRPRIVAEDVPAWLAKEDHVSPLTDKQRAILGFVVSYAVEHLYQPSYREIMARFGLASKNSIFSHFLALREKGWIDYSGGQSRAIRILRKPRISVDYSQDGNPEVAGRS